MQRIPLLLTALSLLPSCANDVATNAATQQATKYEASEGVRCDPSFCILFTAQDSDHDGVADADEIAAGTDPNDPLKYPTMIDLAKLMVAHELPTFEIGNSMMVLLPTRDANGLPVFGGEASLPARKSGLETAGIKIPDGVDLSRGFTMARTAESKEMSFGQLFTAFGGDTKGTMPVRLLADAVGWGPSKDWDVKDGTQDVTGSDGNKLWGTIEGTDKWDDNITGSWQTDGTTTSYHVSSDCGCWRQTVETTKNPDGSTTTKTTTSAMVASGQPGIDRWRTTKSTSTTSANGHDTTTTSHTDYTEYDEDGNEVSSTPGHSSETSCHDGTCDTSTDDPPMDHSDDSKDHDGYLDPDAAQYNGITPTTQGVATALKTLNSTVRVMPDHNDPLASYELPPGGKIHDAYGPIALFGGGDPDSGYTKTINPLGVFGLAPAFARVPQPEYDPNLSEQMPPMNAPPDNTCLYCYQPPLKP